MQSSGSHLPAWERGREDTRSVGWGGNLPHRSPSPHHSSNKPPTTAATALCRSPLPVSFRRPLWRPWLIVSGSRQFAAQSVARPLPIHRGGLVTSHCCRRHMIGRVWRCDAIIWLLRPCLRTVDNHTLYSWLQLIALRAAYLLYLCVRSVRRITVCIYYTLTQSLDPRLPLPKQKPDIGLLFTKCNLM